MVRPSRFSQPITLFVFSLLLALLTLLVGLLPRASLHAAPPRERQPAGKLTESELTPHGLDNVQDDFTFGSFRRTAVNSIQDDENGSRWVTDQPGAVQLMPIGSLTPFEILPGRLPAKLADIGMATMGKYIFIVGGNERVDIEGQEFPEVNRTGKVWVGEVNQQTGIPNWSIQAPDLPEAEVADPSVFGTETGTASAVSFPAVVTVPDEDDMDSGYVYVIGGLATPSILKNSNGSDADISTAAVHIGRFDNESLSWNSVSMLPDIPRLDVNPDRTYGIHGASALHYRTSDGRDFIYVFGGLQNYDTTFDSFNINGSRHIFYAEVGSDGTLYKPSSDLSEEGWEFPPVTTQDGTSAAGVLPIPREPAEVSFKEMGLWFSSAIFYAGTDVDGNDVGDFVYLIGGQRRKNDVDGDPNKFSKIIYRGKLDPDDGSIDWSWDDWQGTLPQNALTHMDSQQFGGNVYIAGGQNHPLDGVLEESYQDILSNFVDDNMEIDIGYFASNDMKRNRYTHGLSIVPAVNSDDYPTTLAFVYVIAGRSEVDFPDPDDSLSNYGTDTILFSRIDPVEAPPIYPLAGGWYYSPRHDTIPLNTEEKTDIVGMFWSADVERTDEITTDIEIEYRVDNKSGGCDASLVFGLSEWQPLSRTVEFTGSEQPTTFSEPGPNSAELRGEDRMDTITCFQYRARLTTDNQEYTPVLLNAGLRVLTDKKPDLWVQTLLPRGDGVIFEDLDVVLKNEWVQENNEDKTANANYDSLSPNTYFVDLYFFAPGQTDLTAMENMPDIPIVGDSDPFSATWHFYDDAPRDMPAYTTFPTNPEAQEQWAWKAIKAFDGYDKDEPAMPQVMEQISMEATGSSVYTACVIVDSYIEEEDAELKRETGYVTEAVEDNNWICAPIKIENFETKVCVQGSEEDAQEHELEPVQGTFTFSRTADSVAEPLDVYFEISGAASYSETQDLSRDYQFDSPPEVTVNGNIGQVTIPADEHTVTISFTPIDDTLDEQEEPVVLKVIKPPEGEATYQAFRESATCQEEADVLILDDDGYLYLPTILR